MTIGTPMRGSRAPRVKGTLSARGASNGVPSKGRMLIAAICGLIAVPALAGPSTNSGLAYDEESRSPAVIPQAERNLQTVVAEPWLRISRQTPGLLDLDKPLVLEGPAFDREGNLVLVEVVGGRVMRVDADRKLTVIVPKNSFGSAGAAIHKDGRIFISGVGADAITGRIFSIEPDGSKPETVVKPESGYAANDLVFDQKGGFYFTDSKGTNADPNGAVYYVSPDQKTVTPVLTGLAMANGIALSPDDKTLWVGEIGKSILHRIEMSSPTTVARWGSTMPYHFTGSNPDGMRVDKDGNLYAGLMGSGRILVFNPKGIPIGQIIVPERDQGRYLYTASIAIKPGSRELFIVASEIDGSEGMIFRSRAFADAPTLYSHR